MSELDETLARWKRETEKVKPSPELMAQLNALAAAQSPQPAAKGVGIATKIAFVLIAGLVLGVLGMLLLAPEPRAALAPLPAAPTRVAPPPRSPAEPGVVDPPPGEAPQPRRNKPSQPQADEPLVLQAVPLQAVPVLRPDGMPPTPPRLASAVENLAFTCAAQRNALVEIISEHGHDDPQAAAAALARWTLLCRTLTGPAIDDYRWFWPWGLAPTNSGSSCKTVMTDPDCADGDNIKDSLDRAAECVRGTTSGSCARRAARLQAVFVSCEALMHRPGGEARSMVDEAVKQLTAEFGAELGAAAWCLEPAAQAEALRIRQGR